MQQMVVIVFNGNMTWDMFLTGFKKIDPLICFSKDKLNIFSFRAQ